MSFLSEKAFVLWDWRWLTTALVFLVSYHVVQFYRKVSKYPKGPFPLPVVGNILTLRSATSLHKMTVDWSRKYGDPFTLWIGEKPMVILINHKLVKEALIERRHEFSGRLSTKMSELQKQGSHGITLEDYNPAWKTLRKVALTASKKYAVSDSLETLCSHVVDHYVDSLKEQSNVVDSMDPFAYILYNVVCISLFGAKFEKENVDLVQLLSSERLFFEIAMTGLPSEIIPLLGPFYRGREKKLGLMMEEFLETLGSLYKQAAQSYIPGEIKSITHSVLEARAEAIEQENNNAQYLTDGSMFQILLDVFGAATDTSSSVLQWLCLKMTRMPEIQERIKKEIEDNLGGHFIPKNTAIVYNIHALNHDPQLWADPEEFSPERFLDPVTGKVNQELLPQLMSFGLGPRTCPGEKMAHVDMFYIIVRFLQRVTCSAPAATSSTPIAKSDSNLFLLPAEQDIVLTRVD